MKKFVVESIVGLTKEEFKESTTWAEILKHFGYPENTECVYFVPLKNIEGELKKET